jgi:hypothetical protein
VAAFAAGCVPEELPVVDSGVPQSDAGPTPDSGTDTDAGTAGEDAGTPGKDGGTLLSYEKDIQPIWNRWCVECHSETKPGEPLRPSPRLDPGHSYDALMGRVSSVCGWLESGISLPFIEPSSDDPEASAVLAITMPMSDRVDSFCLATMPRDRPDLKTASPEDWEKLRLWIAQGALNAPER